jgi:hypothetical protein
MAVVEEGWVVVVVALVVVVGLVVVVIAVLYPVLLLSCLPNSLCSGVWIPDTA